MRGEARKTRSACGGLFRGIGRLLDTLADGVVRAAGSEPATEHAG